MAATPTLSSIMFEHAGARSGSERRVDARSTDHGFSSVSRAGLKLPAGRNFRAEADGETELTDPPLGQNDHAPVSTRCLDRIDEPERVALAIRFHPLHPSLQLMEG